MCAFRTAARARAGRALVATLGILLAADSTLGQAREPAPAQESARVDPQHGVDAVVHPDFAQLELRGESAHDEVVTADATASDDLGVTPIGVHGSPADAARDNRGLSDEVPVFDTEYARPEDSIGASDCDAGMRADVEFCGDLDFDEDVDVDDYWIVALAFGRCVGEAWYVVAADLDLDGCVTLADYSAWVVCYHLANGG